MQINNKQSNISLSGHMTLSQMRKIIRTSSADVERILQDEGISCHFRGNSTLAALNLYGVRIFKSLNLPLPPQIYHGEIRGKVAPSILAQTYLGNRYATKEGDIVQIGGIVFPRKRINLSPISWDKICNRKFKKYYGTTHFLNLIIHEYMHSVLCDKMLKAQRCLRQPFVEILNRMSKLRFHTFQDEITEKIGSYGRCDFMELHAVYWAKEICDSLGTDLLPRYNPIENPQVQLSPFLRKFITCIGNIDIDGANDTIIKSREIDLAIKKAIKKNIINQGKTDKSNPL